MVIDVGDDRSRKLGGEELEGRENLDPRTRRRAGRRDFEPPWVAVLLATK